MSQIDIWGSSVPTKVKIFKIMAFTTLLQRPAQYI